MAKTDYEPVTIMPWEQLPTDVNEHLYYTAGKTNLRVQRENAMEAALGIGVKNHSKSPSSSLLHMHAKEGPCDGEHEYYPRVQQADEPVTPTTRPEIPVAEEDVLRKEWERETLDRWDYG